jgi:hypothetical protein
MSKQHAHSNQGAGGKLRQDRGHGTFEIKVTAFNRSIAIAVVASTFVMEAISKIESRVTGVEPGS